MTALGPLATETWVIRPLPRPHGERPIDGLADGDLAGVASLVRTVPQHQPPRPSQLARGRRGDSERWASGLAGDAVVVAIEPGVSGVVGSATQDRRDPGGA